MMSIDRGGGGSVTLLDVQAALRRQAYEATESANMGTKICVAEATLEACLIRNIYCDCSMVGLPQSVSYAKMQKCKRGSEMRTRIHASGHILLRGARAHIHIQSGLPARCPPRLPPLLTCWHLEHLKDTLPCQISIGSPSHRACRNSVRANPPLLLRGPRRLASDALR